MQFVAAQDSELPDACSNTIDIKYFIYTKNKALNGSQISDSNIEKLKTDLLVSKKKLHIIIHGYLNDQQSGWVQNMAAALLSVIII